MSNFHKYLNTYSFESVLPGSGKTVKYKPITTGQIKKLLLYEVAEDTNAIEEILDELISECVTTPGFNINELYLQDRFYLLVELRRATKGSKYQFQTKCPECESQTQHNIDLGELPIKHLVKPAPRTPVEPVVVAKKKTHKPVRASALQLVEPNKPMEPKEPIIVEVPVTESEWDVVKLNDNISVRLNLLTRQTQIDAMAILEASTKDKEYTDLQKAIMVATITNALCIIGIITPEGEDKEVTLADKVYFLDNLNPQEMEKISKWFESNDFGLEFVMKVKCTHCGKENDRDIPVENFFY